MKLPLSAQIEKYSGWDQVFLENYQVGKKYLNNDGKYLYGLFKGNESGLIQDLAGSNIRFAIIDALKTDWMAGFRSACRNDCDFYVLIGLNDESVREIKKMINQNGIDMVLCIAI